MKDVIKYSALCLATPMLLFIGLMGVGFVAEKLGYVSDDSNDAAE